MNKDSSKRIICLTCSDEAVEGSDYCQDCADVGREKLGLEIPDMCEEAETLRGNVDKASETLTGVPNE